MGENADDTWGCWYVMHRLLRHSVRNLHVVVSWRGNLQDLVTGALRIGMLGV